MRRSASALEALGLVVWRRLAGLHTLVISPLEVRKIPPQKGQLDFIEEALLVEQSRWTGSLRRGKIDVKELHPMSIASI